MVMPLLLSIGETRLAPPFGGPIAVLSEIATTCPRDWWKTDADSEPDSAADPMLPPTPGPHEMPRRTGTWHESLTTSIAERRRRKFGNRTHVRRTAQSGEEIECLPKGHSLHGEIRIASDDSRARRCASIEAEALPPCLRRWLHHRPTARGTTVTMGNRSHELVPFAGTSQEAFVLPYSERVGKVLLTVCHLQPVASLPSERAHPHDTCDCAALAGDGSPQPDKGTASASGEVGKSSLRQGMTDGNSHPLFIGQWDAFETVKIRCRVQDALEYTKGREVALFRRRHQPESKFRSRASRT